MMHKELFFLVIVGILGPSFTVEGRQNSDNINSIWDVSNETQCVEKFFNCIIHSNYSVEKFLRAEKFCCAKTLNDSIDIWFVTFHVCVDVLTARISRRCLFHSGFRCIHKIQKYFERTFPDYLQFDKDVMDKIQPRPSTAEECNTSFIQQYGKAAKDQCQNNTDTNLDPLCNIIDNFVKF